MRVIRFFLVLLLVTLSFSTTRGQDDGFPSFAALEAKVDLATRLLREENRPGPALELAFSCLVDSAHIASNPRLHKANLVTLALCLDKLYRKDLAIPYLYQILEIEEQVVGKETILYEMTLGSLGTYCISLGRDSVAFWALSEAVRHSKSLETQIYHASAINNLGWYWENQGNLDSALSHYDKALAIVSSNNLRDSLLVASIRDNQASVYRKRGQIEESQKILQSNLDFLTSLSRTSDRIVETCISMIQNAFMLNNIEVVPELLEMSRPLVPPMTSLEGLEIRLGLKKAEIEYYTRVGQTDELNRLYEEQVDIMERKISVAQESSEIISRLFAEYATKGYLNEIDRKSKLLELAESEARSKEYLLWVIGGFSILSLILLFLFNRKRVSSQQLKTRVMEQELENEKLKLERAENSLKYMENDVANVLSQMSLRKNWNYEVTEKLSQTLSLPEQEKSESLRKLVNEFRQQGSVYDKFDIQQSGLQEVNARFFAQLKEKYPELTHQEQEFCGFIRLNLDTKEIATLRSIAPASVKKMRHRIRKKMGLNPQEDLHELILSI